MTNFLRLLAQKIGLPGKRRHRSFSLVFREFKDILELNNSVLELIADTNDKLSGDYIFDQHYIETTCKDLCSLVEKMIFSFENLLGNPAPELHQAFLRIRDEIEDEFRPERRSISTEFVLPMTRLSRDLVDIVGAKNANLAELRNALHLPVPRGFAITAAACHAFFEYNGLSTSIEQIFGEWERGLCNSAEASERIREKILRGRIPRKLHRDLRTALRTIMQSHGDMFALRSSALGEDSSYSFAGQYTSIINVSEKGIEEAYKQVVASLYNESAMVYRHWRKFSERETAMPVLCQRMVDSEVSGVLYTYDPQDPAKETMLIDAAWGLGGRVVSGEAPTDQFTVSRHDPRELAGMSIVRKDRRLRPQPGGGTFLESVPMERQTSPCLTREQIAAVAEAGARVERHFRQPQDIEFAFDRRGRLVLLQARPLIIRPYKSSRPEELSQVTARYPVLLEGKGEVAQKGIALGPVYVVRREADLAHFPEAAILVAHYASPHYAAVLNRAAGIITDIGSGTGHLATIAREARIPAIVNCGEATSILRDGMEITMDAEENVVYEGLIRELGYYALSQEPIEETAEYRLLRRILRKVEPLHLLDPQDQNFVPAACTSLHDITRFIHEKSVQELIDFHYYSQSRPGPGTAKLSWDIPLDLVLIDIDGGLKPGAGRKVRPEDIVSAPMAEILKGLGLPGAWDNSPVSVDVGSFLSSMTRTLSPELASPRQLGQNLAVVSAEYVNLSLRVGYHFSMIDSFLSDTLNDNYIYFRFFGGVTGETRRERRARFIGRVLEENDFRVELHGDFAVGRVKKLDREGIARRLRMLGLLIGYTRQLDVAMVSEERVAEHVVQFRKCMEEMV
ncbi:MAG: PEP/pyruvate-binding domain-containing protein [Desulfobulbaceae bacterium]